MWAAGGGLKRGLIYGETDDIGYDVTEKPVHVHDLQATILHLLGIEHTKLTYRFQGRDFRLTDVHGHVVKELMA
jgi:arylsulfatase A-like enzyme